MHFLGNASKNGLKQKKEHYHGILLIPTSLGSKFQLKQTIWIFWNKFAIKRIIPFKNKKEWMNITFEFFIFELGKYQISAETDILWTKLAQKAYFQSKADTVNRTSKFYISELV